MFKKVFLTALSLLAFSGVAFAGNADTEDQRFDRQAIWDTSLSTFVHRISSSGHIFNPLNTGELGSPMSKWKKLHLADNGIETSTGALRTNESFVDLPVASDNIILNQVSAGLTAGQLVTAGTTYVLADLVQSTVPRNIIVFSSWSVGGVAITSVTVTGTCYIRGLDSMGRSTETYQTLVTTSNATAGVGDIAFAVISSVTITVTSTGTANILGAIQDIKIGTGNKIGLVNKFNAVGDIYHVNEAGTRTTSYTANSTYNTIDFATDGNSVRDYTVRYINKYFTPLP